LIRAHRDRVRELRRRNRGHGFQGLPVRYPAPGRGHRLGGRSPLPGDPPVRRVLPDPRDGLPRVRVDRGRDPAPRQAGYRGPERPDDPDPVGVASCSDSVAAPRGRRRRRDCSPAAVPRVGVRPAMGRPRAE